MRLPFLQSGGWSSRRLATGVVENGLAMRVRRRTCSTCRESIGGSVRTECASAPSKGALANAASQQAKSSPALKSLSSR
jgi:hypothetical protein